VPGSHAGHWSGGLVLVAVAAGGLTFLIRLALHGRSFDLFGDEVIYTRLGRSVVSGGFPRFGGAPFFLHGPGFFYLEAGWQRLWGNQAGLVAQVNEMRMLNVLLATATAVTMLLLAARAGSPRAGAAAGLLFALDPFSIRQNDRVLLETAMMLWVLLGYLAYTSLLGRLPPRREWPRAVGAGVMFGLAVLTKDEAVLLTVLPVLAAAALRWGPRWRLAALTVGTTVAVYAAYVALVAVNGYLPDFWQAKASGVQRLLGVIQTTGFHSSGGGSLAARLVAEGPYFTTTYVLLALAVLALLLVLRRGGPVARMLGLMYCAAAATLAYALTLGTLEEQELYLLVIPSLGIVPVAVTHLRPTGRRGKTAVRERRAMPAAAVPRGAVAVTALVLALGLNLVTCALWFREPDDGFARLLSYMAAHVPPGTKVADAGGYQNDVGEYVLAGQYDVGLWLTPAALSREHVGYVLAEWAEIDEDYSSLTPVQARHLVSGGRAVFSFRGRTYGDLELYQLPPSSGHLAPRDGPSGQPGAATMSDHSAGDRRIESSADFGSTPQRARTR
jgi:hypothetical protein